MRRLDVGYRPFIHLNCALSVDGHMGTDDGKALQISCDEDWQRVHALREAYDGVAVGARTWIGDQPRLTVRREVLGREPSRQPARVIFAGGWQCEVTPGRRPTFLVGRHQPSSAGAIHIRSRDRRLSAVLESLHGYEIRSLLVEGGPTLLHSFLDQGIFDRLTFYVPTRDSESARRAVNGVFPTLPGLSSQRLGTGTLLGYHGVRPRQTEPPPGMSVSPVPGKLTHLELDRTDDPEQDPCLAVLGPVPLPILVAGEPRRFDWYVFARTEGKTMPRDPLANSALVFGDPDAVESPLVRVHSGCHTGDVFSSMRCDCGAQLEKALCEIVEEGAGVAVYLTEHEGRGIGLWAKAMAYLLQDHGRDTYEANVELGYPEDARGYDEASTVLGWLLASRRIRLLSNNPQKRSALRKWGFEVVEMCSLVAGHNHVNHRYIEAKVRNGHLLPGRGRNE